MATFRRFRQDIFSFRGGVIGLKNPTLSYPHGIGGNAAVRITRIVVVEFPKIVDIAKVGRAVGDNRKYPCLLRHFSF
jgi:hypothetical protein